MEGALRWEWSKSIHSVLVAEKKRIFKESTFHLYYKGFFDSSNKNTMDTGLDRFCKRNLTFSNYLCFIIPDRISQY